MTQRRNLIWLSLRTDNRNSKELTVYHYLPHSFLSHIQRPQMCWPGLKLMFQGCTPLAIGTRQAKTPWVNAISDCLERSQKKSTH